jgi:hypothetical protein
MRDVVGAGDGDLAKLTSWLTKARLNGPSLSAQTRPLLGGCGYLVKSTAVTVRFLLLALATVARLKGNFLAGLKFCPALTPGSVGIGLVGLGLKFAAYG